jgi:hypothetical protein
VTKNKIAVGGFGSDGVKRYGGAVGVLVVACYTAVAGVDAADLSGDVVASFWVVLDG